MTEQQAMRMALEALSDFDYDKRMSAITALRQALEQQPADEPVAWWHFNKGFDHCMTERLNEVAKQNPAPLYTRPQPAAWVGLTDEEMIECERLADIRHRKHMGSIRGQQLSSADQFLWHYARAIEAALRSKST